MKLVSSPANPLPPPSPLASVLLYHRAFALAVLSACTLFPQISSTWLTPSAPLSFPKPHFLMRFAQTTLLNSAPCPHPDFLSPSTYSILSL